MDTYTQSQSSPTADHGHFCFQYEYAPSTVSIRYTRPQAPLLRLRFLAISRFTLSSCSLPIFQKLPVPEARLSRTKAFKTSLLTSSSIMRASVNTGRDTPLLRIDSQPLSSTGIGVQPLLPHRSMKAMLFPIVALGPLNWQGAQNGSIVKSENIPSVSCTADVMSFWI